MTFSVVPKNKANLNTRLKKRTLSKCIDVKNLVLTHYPELKEKSDKYLGDAIAVLATEGCNARHFKKFVECNPEVFDKKRFWKLTDYLLNAVTKVYYQPEYHQLLRGLSYQDAEQYVISYKANKATSREKFIERHGKIKGEQMFSTFQKTSEVSTQNMKDNGSNFRERSHWCVEYWEKLGCSYEEAVTKVSECQHTYAGVNENVWRLKGLSHEEIQSKMEDINQKKGAARSYEKLKVKNPEWGEDKLREEISRRKLSMLNSFVGKGYRVPLERQEDYKVYRDKVRRLTENQDLSKVEGISLRSVYFHLDHKYSIMQGFLDNVPTYIMASLENLQIISAEDNNSKGIGCSISLEDLLEPHNLIGVVERVKVDF